MNIRERVSRGQSVRIVPLAVEVGLPQSTLYNWAKTGKLDVIRAEGTILVPAAAAAPLLGMSSTSAPAEPVAA